MNPSSSADTSLYQLTQKFNPAPQPLTVSNATFKGIVKALINFLIEQQLPATVWIKFPGLDEIKRYYQVGNATQIYYCTTRLKQLEEFTNTFKSFEQAQYSTLITPIVLESRSGLKQEAFFIVLSSEFCCTLLGKRLSEITQDGTNNALRKITWNLIYSFEPNLIQQLLERLKQSINVTDTTPEEVLINNHLPFSLPTQFRTNLLNSLLKHQIQQMERMQIEDHLTNQSNQEIKRLKDSEQFKSEVLKNLSQEISLPITNMKTALLLLNSRQSKKEHRQRYLDLLQRECDRQSLVVTGLLELVAFDQPTNEQGTTQKLEDLVPGIVSTYQPLAEEKGISMGYTVPPDLPVVACPDGWLKQILQNLLNNSLKYTPTGGRILVKAFLKENHVELTISDTGIGIDSNEIPKIFNSFYRGKVNDPNGGAGLGLTIVKYLLKCCGGDILVSSRIDQGTTFTVILPIVNPEDD